MLPLREEAEAAIKEDGWTKDAFASMWKLDSFLRESQRLNGFSGGASYLICVIYFSLIMNTSS